EAKCGLGSSGRACVAGLLLIVTVTLACDLVEPLDRVVHRACRHQQRPVAIPKNAAPAPARIMLAAARHSDARSPIRAPQRRAVLGMKPRNPLACSTWLPYHRPTGFHIQRPWPDSIASTQKIRCAIAPPNGQPLGGGGG